MNRGQDKRPTAYTIVVAILAAVVLFAMLKGCDDCTEKGGAYVRGAIWYSCVQPAEVTR